MGKWDIGKDVDRIYDRYVKDNVDEDLIKQLDDEGGVDVEVTTARDILSNKISDLEFTRKVNLVKSPDLAVIMKGIVDLIYKKPPIVKPPKVELPKKEITQLTRKGGTSYARAKPRPFTVKEIAFIKVAKRQKKPNKEIIEGFNKIFKPRNKSSILSKKYRIK